MRLRSDFAFGNGDVLRPAATESRVAVNGVAHLEPCHFRARFLHHAGNVVAGDQRQVRPEFSGVFPAERERVGWVDAARNHTHEHFILLRLRPRHLFEFQHFGGAVLVRDHRLHHRLFVRTCEVSEENC